MATVLKITSLVVATAFLAVSAQAQVCLGVPSSPGQVSFVGNMGFLGDDVRSYGGEVMLNGDTPLSVGAGYALVPLNQFGLRNMNVFSGGAALDLGHAMGASSSDVSVCPAVRVSATSYEGFQLVTVPFGLSIGTSLEFADGDSKLIPYVQPGFVYVRERIDGDSWSETFVGAVGGVNLAFGSFFFGGTALRIFEVEQETTFGLQAGVTF